MNVVIQIAWRNIWRNRSRSFVLIGAIIIGVWAGITVASVSNGLVNERFNRLIENEISHVQIHHSEYLQDPNLEFSIALYEAIEESLANHPEIAAFSPRTLSDGMIQSPVTAAGVQIMGINPSQENATTNIGALITEGDFFEEASRNQIVIGTRLSDRLRMDVGNRIVLSFQDVSGELVSAAFTVSGIISAASPMLDERVVFVSGSDLRALLNESIYHEILIKLSDPAMSVSVAESINSDFDLISAQTWYEVSPELQLYSEMGNIIIYIIMGIILMALAFGILNTMLMSIFERYREIGMLMAIGMNKKRVFSMITVESIFLTVTGGALGMILSAILLSWLMRTGIDLSVIDAGMEAFGYGSQFYPSISVGAFLGVSLMVVLTALLAAIYPAYKALKIPPADSIRA